MPPGISFPDGVKVWAPLAMGERTRQARSSIFLDVVARLAEGTTLEQGRAEIETIARAAGDGLSRRTNAGMGMTAGTAA